MMDSSPIEKMPVGELTFDLQNPRLVEFEVSKSDVVQTLWDVMDVRELVLSIAASGFFQHEPLIVEKDCGENVVIEGNRRLAAVRVLLDPSLVDAPSSSIPVIGPKAKKELECLPVIFRTREQAWRYIGFKHVNGPAKWTSYAKSQYIARVYRDYGVPLADIASQIGDTHRTVQRLFRGMMVIEQAERMDVFDREDRWRRHFSFSHLYAGLDYTGISAFIGLRPEGDETAEPVPADKKEQLRELFLWLYGSKRQDIRPAIRTQNPDLRRLDAVVANRESVAALRAGNTIETAFEISRPAANVFEDSLTSAKRNLEKARGLASTAYDGSEHLLRVAEEVATIADDLWADMDRMSNRRRRRRRERIDAERE